ncbi:hypothetical protein CS062_17325 [Roseateles chitinivorans]|uniref:Uncharacterized protein n=1 Tax=Roseateles chitinivorans TaxID=2917965 RepID=A0A2G9C673_9BURK|nr:hypothetical protein [Roseateles chitinivorans]PIM51887.1 hypothetical protein CS062_17325 [Roseateles chitinivorans]
MRFEIVNPSDPYTMEAEDLEVAAVACGLIGQGRYGLKALSPDAGAQNDVPIFLLGGHDEWFIGKFGMDWENTARHVLDHRRDALAAAAASVTLDRAERSSLNNIGAIAKQLAKALRSEA